MKKCIIIFLVLNIININSYSQIIFEDGYFIDQANQKTICLIKNVDWKDNPTEFEYKMSQGGAIQTANIQDIKEFGINGASKYIRANVKIDKSGDKLDNMNYEKKPIFEEETLFLKVIVEGKASLFQYESGALKRYFFKLDDSNIDQLVYKRYLLGENKFAVNNTFRNQLFNGFQCQELTIKDFENIKYAKPDLLKLFLKYNECANVTYFNFESIQKRDWFNLAVRPGLNFSNLEVLNPISEPRSTDFGNRLNFRFGIEAEFILPYNKGKWGLLFEPTFQYFKTEVTTEVTYVAGGVLTSKANYQSMEFPIGLRHYFFLNDRSKIFLNVTYTFDFINNSNIELIRSDGSIFNTLVLRSNNNMGIGLGYKYTNKWSIEMRHHFSRDLLWNHLYWTSEYNTLSMILGYRVF